MSMDVSGPLFFLHLIFVNHRFTDI